MSDVTQTASGADLLPMEPVVRSIIVHQDREAVFDVFTEDMADWWPILRHSLGGDKVADVVFEHQAGGRVYERWADGTEVKWADVLAYQRPERVVLAWQPNHDSPAPTEVEITFKAEGGSTVVRLEHRGWERLGPTADEARDSYEQGWPGVLARFSRRAADPACGRAYAVGLNQLVWTLLGGERGPEDDEAMLNAAHASLHHWTEVGGPLERGRGEWLVSHVYAVLGRAEPACHHAERALAVLEAEGVGDFDLAYGYEGVARAAALSGVVDRAAEFRDMARAAAEAITEPEDRALFDADLAAGPWYALDAPPRP